MASFKEDSENLRDKILSAFPGLTEFKLVMLKFGGNIPVAFASFNTSDGLSKIWAPLNSYLIGHFAAALEDEFSKWNFYMFCICANTVNRATKYEIENNKFGSRKIVIEKTDTVLGHDRIDQLLDEHITNADLITSETKREVSTFKKNGMIDKYLAMIPEGKKADRESDYINALTKLEKAISDETKKS